MIEGRIELNVINANNDSYTAKINSKTFNLSRAGYDALRELVLTDGAQVVYRVYYAPGNSKILSLEKRVGERV